MKNIKIGAWDGEQVLIQVEDNATVSDALRTAGLSLAPTQSVTTFSDAQDVGLGDAVRDGETYLLTGNQTSGSLSFNQTVNGIEFIGDNSSSFGKLFSYRYEERKNQFCQMLNFRGVKKVVSSIEPVEKSILYFNELTLLQCPNIIGVAEDSQPEGFSLNLLSLHKSKSFNILDNNDERIRITTQTNKIIADYYKNRNLIICYTYIFLIDPRVRIFQEILNLIFKTISPNLQIVDIKGKLKEISSKTNLALFSTSLKRELSFINDNINNNIRSIDNHTSSIFSLEKQRVIYCKTKEAIENLLSNFDTEFESKLNELKELTFLKSYSIQTGFIYLDFGDIEISVKKETRESNYYIGHIIAEIHPDRIKFRNLNNIPKEGALHPHIRGDGTACFGSFSTDIMKLLASSQLKKLTILLRQFLYTWNPDSPIAMITYWKSKPFSEYNKKEIDLTQTNQTITPQDGFQNMLSRATSLTPSQKKEFIAKLRERSKR